MSGTVSTASFCLFWCWPPLCSSVLSRLNRSMTMPGLPSAQGMFHLISIATTTGYTSSGFYWWPGALPVMLILLSFMGGCAGSTAGGIKVMRIQMMYKQGRKEIVRLIHPNAVLSIKAGRQVISDQIVNTVTAFFSMYILCYAVTDSRSAQSAGLDYRILRGSSLPE